MFYLFKSQGFRSVSSILDSNGFNNSQFKNYRIGQIVMMIANKPSMFVHLLQVIREIKLNPLRLLKIQMLVHHLLQTDPSMQQNQKLFQFMQELSAKGRNLLRNSSRSQRLSTTQDNIKSNKETMNTSWQTQINQCENGVTLLLLKIIQPLFQLQEKLIFSYDVIYKPQKSVEMDYDRCWATINLLRKFLEIGPGIQDIGRYYYKEYASPMIYLIKVLDVDIQLLYKRIKTYVSQRVCEVDVLTKEGRLHNLEGGEQQRMEQLLLLIQQLEGINEKIHLLYSGKYFLNQLVANDIYRPCLYVTQLKLDMFYHLKRGFSRKISRTQSYNQLVKRSDSSGIEVVQEV